jgi:hypothetical protein
MFITCVFINTNPFRKNMIKSFIALLLISGSIPLSAQAETIYMGSGNGATVGGGVYVKNTATKTEEQANSNSNKSEVIISDVGYSLNITNSKENAKNQTLTIEEQKGILTRESLDFSQDFGVSYP